MSNHRFQSLLPALGSVIHPFKNGDCVKACSIAITHRPLFVRAKVLAAVDDIADLYWGRLEGDHRDVRFFAHPAFQDGQAESALLQHYRATLQPEGFGLDFGFALQREGRG